MAMYHLCCVLLCLFASLACGFDPSKYTASQKIDPLDYTVYWKVNEGANEINIALKVKTLGWVGFGIAEITSGSMPGADIIQGGHDAATGKGYVYDRWSDARLMPVKDGCQDVILVNSEETMDGYTILEVKRPITTNDTQDRSIVYGPNRVIVSYSYDGSDEFGYHGDHRRTSEITFWGQPLYTSLPVPGEKTMDLTINNFMIPNNKTVYVCQAYKTPEDADYYVTQIDPLVNATNIGHVHHFVAHICVNETNNPTRPSIVATYQKPGVCSSPLGNINRGCTGIMMAWAAGGGSVFTPADVGFAMGLKSTSIKWIVIEVHYNNPTGVGGYVDNSGLRIHYSTTPKKYEAGVITLGDAFTQFLPIPNNTIKEYESECMSDCTNRFTQDITFFHSFPHMHQVGTKMWTTQWRDGQEIDEIGRIEFWSFDHQLTQELNKTVKKGDRFNTHCVYDTTGMADPVKFGIASTEEMCMHFISYYPRLYTANNLPFSFCGALQAITACGSANTTERILLPNPQHFDPPGGNKTTFGASGSVCTATPTPTPLPEIDSSASLTVFSVVILAFAALLCL